VLSSRRVKKGPGARPMSAKRARFMELRARGWSVRAAVREVGVSRSCGANWSRGYKTYRNGEVIGFVAPLDRLAVREVSARYLSQDVRFIIADRRRAGDTVRAIATDLGRAPSTISRELRRNARPWRGLRPVRGPPQGGSPPRAAAPAPRGDQRRAARPDRWAGQ
jgi:transposase, IS30 family